MSNFVVGNSQHITKLKMVVEFDTATGKTDEDILVEVNFDPTGDPEGLYFIRGVSEKLNEISEELQRQQLNGE